MRTSFSLIAAIVVSLAALPSYAYRGKRNSPFAAVYRNKTFNDLQSSETTTAKVDLGKTDELELGLRFHSLYQLIFLNGSNEENTRKYFGGGIRIDTLGPFWLARNTYRAVRNNARFYPVNTSFYAAVTSAKIQTSTGAEEKFTESNFGIALDVFLFNPYVFLSGQAGLLHSQGNAFTSYSIGLGAEF